MKETRVLFASDIHYCEMPWFGLTRDEKAERFCSAIKNEYEANPFDALLLLGDYSLDHWVWHTKGTYLTEGISNTKLFTDRYLNSLLPEGVTLKMIAGNHEQYGETLFTELTGHKRRDHLVLENTLFILTDTFGGDLDPTEHSDGTYIGANAYDITELINTYPDKNVILCAHWFDMDKETEAFKELLRRETRIKCLVCGHNHRSVILSTGEENGNLPILCTGHFSYSGEKDPKSCLFGYREITVTDSAIVSKYISPANTYTIDGITYTNEYTEQDKIIIPI